jgi:hypothetical protein
MALISREDGVMMKSANSWGKLAVCVACTLMLAGCSTLRSEQSEYRSSKEFSRKVQCETYASKTEQEFRDGDREWGGRPGETMFSVERSFYSSKRNSCVVILRETTSVRGELIEHLQTIDTLTKEDLGYKAYSDNGHDAPRDNLRKDVEQQVRNLE